MVKPNFQGSTIGLSIVDNVNGIKDAIDVASIYSDNIIVEKFIKGRELTVGFWVIKLLILLKSFQSQVFMIINLNTPKGQSDYICPAKLDGNLLAKIKKKRIKDT